MVWARAFGDNLERAGHRAEARDTVEAMLFGARKYFEWAAEKSPARSQSTCILGQSQTEANRLRARTKRTRDARAPSTKRAPRRSRIAPRPSGRAESSRSRFRLS